jgi:hypothetical protein
MPSHHSDSFSAQGTCGLKKTWSKLVEVLSLSTIGTSLSDNALPTVWSRLRISSLNLHLKAIQPLLSIESSIITPQAKLRLLFPF